MFGDICFYIDTRLGVLVFLFGGL